MFSSSAVYGRAGLRGNRCPVPVACVRLAAARELRCRVRHTAATKRRSHRAGRAARGASFSHAYTRQARLALPRERLPVTRRPITLCSVCAVARATQHAHHALQTEPSRRCVCAPVAPKCAPSRHGAGPQIPRRRRRAYCSLSSEVQSVRLSRSSCIMRVESL